MADDFSDHLFHRAAVEELEESRRLKGLVQLYESTGVPAPQSTFRVVKGASGEPTLGIYFSQLANIQDLDKALTLPQLSFIICKEISVPHDILRQSLHRSSKPVWIELEDFSPSLVVQSRLIGFSGYICSIESHQDLASLQFTLEFGGDFDMEAALRVNDEQHLALVQSLDCPICIVSSSLVAIAKEEIANTRILLIHLESDEHLDARLPQQHSYALIMPKENLKLDP